MCQSTQLYSYRSATHYLNDFMIVWTPNNKKKSWDTFFWDALYNIHIHLFILILQLICSYVFMPLAYMMGTDWDDCRLVAELIGTKTFINEFVAYERLSQLIENRDIPGAETLSVSTFKGCYYDHFWIHPSKWSFWYHAKCLLE